MSLFSSALPRIVSLPSSNLHECQSILSIYPKPRFQCLHFFHQILWHMFHVATYKLKILLFSAEEVPALIKLGLIIYHKQVSLPCHIVRDKVWSCKAMSENGGEKESPKCQCKSPHKLLQTDFLFLLSTQRCSHFIVSC